MQCDRDGCTSSGKTCGRCSCTFFCSLECQKLCHADHRKICKGLAGLKVDEARCEFFRKQIGLSPKELYVCLRYPSSIKTIIPETLMPTRHAVARKISNHMTQISPPADNIKQMYARYPMEDFYMRHNPANGISSAARIFGVAMYSDVGDNLSSTFWTCGCRVLTEEGRRMMKTDKLCQNVFVPVEARYLTRVTKYPLEVETMIRTFSETPGVFLDPSGWQLAAHAYNDHDKKCTGCGSECCESCGNIV